MIEEAVMPAAFEAMAPSTLRSGLMLASGSRPGAPFLCKNSLKTLATDFTLGACSTLCILGGSEDSSKMSSVKRGPNVGVSSLNIE